MESITNRIVRTYHRYLYKIIEKLLTVAIKLTGKMLDLLDLMIIWRNKHKENNNGRTTA